jgi:hypothetical protein
MTSFLCCCIVSFSVYYLLNQVTRRAAVIFELPNMCVCLCVRVWFQILFLLSFFSLFCSQTVVGQAFSFNLLCVCVRVCECVCYQFFCSPKSSVCVCVCVCVCV